MLTVIVAVGENGEVLTCVEAFSLLSGSIQNFTVQRSLDAAEIRWNLELNSQFIIVIKAESREVLNEGYFVNVVVGSHLKLDAFEHFDIYRASVDV